MAFCTKCGATLQDEVKFCTECGNAISASGQSADQNIGGVAPVQTPTPAPALRPLDDEPLYKPKSKWGIIAMTIAIYAIVHVLIVVIARNPFNYKTARDKAAEAPRVIASFELSLLATLAETGDIRVITEDDLIFQRPTDSKLFTYSLTMPGGKITATSKVKLGKANAGATLTSVYNEDEECFHHIIDPKLAVLLSYFENDCPKPRTEKITTSSSSSSSSQSAAQNVDSYFRIQIFANANESLARREKQRAGSVTNLPVWVGMEQSMYKVYVGEFNTSAEARKVLPEIKKSYPDAWIPGEKKPAVSDGGRDSRLVGTWSDSGAGNEVFTFRADGSFEVEDYNYDTEEEYVLKGTWNTKGNLIILTYSNGRQDSRIYFVGSSDRIELDGGGFHALRR